MPRTTFTDGCSAVAVARFGQVYPDCPCRNGLPDLSAGDDAETAALLAHLYLCGELSTYRIASSTGLNRQRVTRLLRQAGVPLRPQGAGRRRPERRRGDPDDLPALLGELYLRRRLTTAQVQDVLGIPERTIRDRLARYGIQARTRGAWERESRRTVPPEVLRELYTEAGLTAGEIGGKLGASISAVLRNAHDQGIPVRAGGTTAPAGAPEIELINALYADPLIAAALTRHKVPRAAPGGPIWQRFPQPVPLTQRMVIDLYWECGAGLNHIELLTGQPAQTVRGFMRRSGIPVRHAGGRSPFMRRWHRHSK